MQESAIMSDEKRLALVTGGVQGLGAATAKRLQTDGFNVIATHLGGGEQAARFADDTGLPVYEWDVSDPVACEENLGQIQKEHGPVAVLVNNAGINRDAMFHKMSHDDWDAVMRVDLGSMFNMTSQVIKPMRENGYGRIINISSVNAQKGQPGQTNYCAAKAGIIGFTKALALECAGKGITVNVVAPGYADTEMVQKVPEKVLGGIIDSVPVGRLAEPSEVARCIAFLASEDAGFITGATLAVNGGLYMQ